MGFEPPGACDVVDAAGASLSAVTLGGIMQASHQWVGMRAEVRHGLALPPVAFALYPMSYSALNPMYIQNLQRSAVRVGH
jgi:hypothetical protein